MQIPGNNGSGSKELSTIGPRHVGTLDTTWLRSYNSADALSQELKLLGVNISPVKTSQMMDAMDALEPSITAGSMATPIQFLQAWLPGLVLVTTAKRQIDEILGLTTVGAWEDEEVVQAVLERGGKAAPYGDVTNLAYANWNVNFEKRTNIPFKLGMRVDLLEEKRAARMEVNSAMWKRNAAANELEIVRNAIGFVGYNGGVNRTYGFLNDPGEPAYVAVPPGASGFSDWARKTLLEIEADLRGAYAALRIQSKEMIDPAKTQITLVVATSVREYLTVSSDFGYSVQKWINDNFPMTRVISAPELDAANGGANVFYMFAEQIDDGSTDDRRVFSQNVTSKFFMLGVEQKINGYREGYSNATAGVMCKRPWGMVRRTGV